MFDQTARFYDLVYGGLKDYAAESDTLAKLIRSRHPGAQHLLDVGCGTGEHARHLSEDHGFRVDGIDLEAEFVSIARAKTPRGEFTVADMTAFDLGRTYDVVLCLFGSIGYVLTLENLGRAFANMVRHLSTGGLLIVEPWLQPDGIRHGHVTLHTAEADDVKICRMSYTEKLERVSRIRFEYLVGDSYGLHRLSECHELGLFTRTEMERAFADVDVAVEYDPEGIFGRGLYFGNRG